MMSAGHNILHDLLRAFTDNGPGLVRLAATDTGVKIPNERLIQMVIPTWGVNTNSLVLPSPEPGKIVIVAGAATGGKLQSSVPATVKINGTANGGKSSVAANQMVVLICESSTSWKAVAIAEAGTVSALPIPS